MSDRRFDPLSWVRDMLGQPQRWRELDSDALDELIRECLLHQGVLAAAQLQRPLHDLYAHAVARLDLPRRRAIQGYIVRHMDRGYVGPDALLLLIRAETDAEAVARATRDVVSARGPDERELLANAAALIACARAGEARRPGAILGALLALGDPGICGLLVEPMGELGLDDLDTVVAIEVRVPSLAQVEFWLRWMEVLQLAGDEGRIARCAEALLHLAHGARRSGFIDAAQSGARVRRIEAGWRYSPRLRALEAAPPAGRHASAVRKAFVRREVPLLRWVRRLQCCLGRAA